MRCPQACHSDHDYVFGRSAAAIGVRCSAAIFHAAPSFTHTRMKRSTPGEKFCTSFHRPRFRIRRVRIGRRVGGVGLKNGALVRSLPGDRLGLQFLDR